MEKLVSSIEQGKARTGITQLLPRALSRSAQGRRIQVVHGDFIEFKRLEFGKALLAGFSGKINKKEVRGEKKVRNLQRFLLKMLLSM